MTAPIDRRRFLTVSLTGLAGTTVVLLGGPGVVTGADATPVARGPNLVFDPSFEKDLVGGSPRGWVIS